MKKKYIKPMVSFEKLAMNSSFSGHCEFNITFAEWVCPVLIPEWGETVFQQDNCDWSNDDYYICYHVPTISTNIFGS
jgi:hypothetical protein